MAKNKTIFVCQECGATRPKWEGQCRECNAWNSFVEEKEVKASSAATKGWSLGDKKAVAVSLGESRQTQDLKRWNTGLHELDRVLGGGMVPGSYILLGGDPGIGKSTLLMQMCGALGKEKRNVLYVSGEESVDQTAMRATRLGVNSDKVKVASENRLPLIMNLVEKNKPEVLIVDSIQTIYQPELQSAPGTVSQVRECAAQLMAIAKGTGTSVFLVGHITKDGSLAGPKTLEHMVDTVLHFEGDTNHQFRLLRAQKNRFGPTNELGVFQMSGEGLEEVSNPSELFLAERGNQAIGSAVFPAMEGTRPLLCEVQSLTNASYIPSPSRTAIGFDRNRIQMIAAVLDKHLGKDFAKNDVFVTIAGGLKINEPSADLAAAAAMLSTLEETDIDSRTVFFGEIGLTGEVRAATFAVDRLKEAEKLGFTTAILPKGNEKHVAKSLKGSPMELHFINSVDEIMSLSKARVRKVVEEELDFN